jgi:hypothetical protein
MRYSVLLVAALVVLSGCSGLTGGDGAPGNETDVGTTAASPAPTTTDGATTAPPPSDESPTTAPPTTAPPTTAPPTTEEPRFVPDDPAEDRLGWEDGYWYNESIDVDRSDGLNDSELDAVVARGMARVEHVRQLEFEKKVPVKIVSREEFAANSTGYDYSTVDRLHQNTKWEAMLMVNESTNALSVQESNTAASVGGYYSPSEERIVIVSENTTSPKMNEITLAQELFHALQDQRFNLSRYDYSTQESHNANDGIVEGDGNFVDRLYEQECDEGSWGDCLMPSENGGGGGGGSIHFGMYFVSFQPYSDGPKFVKQIYEEGGWDAVNAVYENPPASTEQTIHPEKYEEDAPTEMTFEDTSGEEWDVLEMGEGSINYATFGEAGLASMLFYPYYDSGRQQNAPVVGVYQFFNLTEGGGVSSFDPLNYSNEYTTGWDGDRLYPYVNESSAETNETGYVWKLEWDSEQDAREFVDGYEQLLVGYYGAQPVDGHPNTYRIPEGQQYADAFYVKIDGSTVYIVNAPTVDDLDEVRAGAGTAA